MKSGFLKMQFILFFLQKAMRPFYGKMAVRQPAQPKQ